MAKARPKSSVPCCIAARDLWKGSKYGFCKLGVLGFDTDAVLSQRALSCRNWLSDAVGWYQVFDAHPANTSNIKTCSGIRIKVFIEFNWKKDPHGPFSSHCLIYRNRKFACHLDRAHSCKETISGKQPSPIHTHWAKLQRYIFSPWHSSLNL